MAVYIWVCKLQVELWWHRWEISVVRACTLWFLVWNRCEVLADNFLGGWGLGAMFFHLLWMPKETEKKGVGKTKQGGKELGKTTRRCRERRDYGWFLYFFVAGLLSGCPRKEKLSLREKWTETEKIFMESQCGGTRALSSAELENERGFSSFFQADKRSFFFNIDIYHWQIHLTKNAWTWRSGYQCSVSIGDSVGGGSNEAWCSKWDIGERKRTMLDFCFWERKEVRRRREWKRKR